MTKLKEHLTEAKNWKDDPWGVRDELAERARAAARRIEDVVDPWETAFFYDKNTKHINVIGKQLQMIEKAVVALEQAVKKAKSMHSTPS